MANTTAACSPRDQLRFRPQRSCSRKMSALAAMRLNGLRHDAYVADAGLLHRIHDGGKGAERYVFISAHIDRLMLWITDFLPQLAADFVDVHCIVAQEHLLLAINGDHHS